MATNGQLCTNHYHVLEAFYDDIRKVKMNNPEKSTHHIKMTHRMKGNYDKHRLNMLLRKLSVPKFDTVIKKKETFSTIRLVTTVNT